MAQTNSAAGAVDDFFLYSTEMVFVAAEDGVILRRSRALTQAMSPEILDADPQAGLAPLVHPDDRRPFDEAWRRLRAATEPVTLDLRLKTAGGSFKPFQCVARWVPETKQVYGALHATEEQLKQQIKLMLLQALNDHLPICLWAIDEHGVFILHDGKGLDAAGVKRGQYVGLNVFDIYPEEGTADLRKALSGEVVSYVGEANGRHWDAWYLPVRNARGDVICVAGINLDTTESKRAELDLIKNQQQVIRSLSTPIIQVWDRVLTLPLVGMFDGARAAEVMESVLREVVRTRARYAILDLTGIEAMDTATADHLLKLAQAIKLLGAEGIITGIHPTSAQALVGLGVDLSSIVTRSTLREGLEHCIQRMSATPGRRSRA